MIKYAITDPSFFNPQNIDNYYIYKDVDFLLFRDKSASCYAQVANLFIENSKKFNYKTIIHQDYILAKELKAYGVHLNSKQLIAIERAKELGLFVVVSTHTLKEAREADISGADAITYSPIYSTPNKGKPKGIDVLKDLVDAINIKVIALGGIVTSEHIKEIERSNSWGFASIRYFRNSI